MSPTMPFFGEMYLVERFTPRLRQVQPGDIIEAKSPTDPNKTIVKRVVGLVSENCRSHCVVLFVASAVEVESVNSLYICVCVRLRVCAYMFTKKTKTLRRMM
jgi:Signal peptidase, peptidase S26